MNNASNYYLDITSDECPITFVRTKLYIERMHVGDVLEVRLSGAEPLQNVPKSVAELGHDIISLAAEPGSTSTGPHRLLIRKTR